MNVEYTGRQFEITAAVRKQLEHGLAKLEKIFGGKFHTHVILTAEKRRHKAEITITLRNHPIVGVAEAAEMNLAISAALEHIDSQAVKYKSRLRSKKRNAGKKKWDGEAPSAPLPDGVKNLPLSGMTMRAHSFPEAVYVTETHIVKNRDAVALRPLTLDEAIKEAEFRDREVFVFRDAQGNVKVLHRRKNGKLELIEAP